MLNPQDLNPVSVRRAENEVKDHVDLESQGDIKQTSFQIIADLRRSLDILEKKIDGGGLDGVKRPNLTARRVGILEVVRNVIEKMTANIRGGGSIDPSPDAALGQDRPAPAPYPDDLGFGYGATHQALDSVQTDPSKLTEGYRVIKKNDETVQDTFPAPPSQLPDSAVQPDVQDDAQLIKAYYELVNSLNDRVEDMDETSKELHIQTGKKDSPAITVQVLGFKKDPYTTAAKQQEDSTGALPPTDKITGYESYMKPSSANPKRFG